MGTSLNELGSEMGSERIATANDLDYAHQQAESPQPFSTSAVLFYEHTTLVNLTDI